MIRIGVRSFVAGGGTPPANTVAPVISGTQVVGQTLSSTTGTWTGDPTPTYTYQWYRGATLISGATSSTYTLVQADAGNTSNISCIVTATNLIGTATATSNTLAQILDSDANGFLTSASISDSTQKNAINTLVIDLKGYSIWSKMKAIYPFVGGTATTHKWNLKDPRDLDAAFRLVFSGGWTHSSNGALPNGTNAYADTFLIPSSTLSATSTHFSYYSRTNTTTNNGSEIGSWNTSFSSGIELSCYRNWTNAKTYVNVNNATRAEATAQNSAGFFVGSRIANNNAFMLRNSSVIATQTATLTCVLPTFNVYMAATNNFGSVGNYSTKECAFASIGDGLTTTEAANLYTAVQAYQTTLSRNV
jgi:hypothetical protein